MRSYILVNESTLTDDSVGGELTSAVLDAIVAATLWQLNGDFARAWGGAYAVRHGALSDALPNEIVVHIQDALSVANAAGYHDKTDSGGAEIFIAREGSISLTYGGESLSVTISHELCEDAADPAANRWVDQGQGIEEALEACDRVEDRFYQAPNGVCVSDFLLSSAFDPGASRPYSQLDSLEHGTDMTAGGYQLVRTVATDEHQATPGHALLVGSPRAARLAKCAHVSSRAYRRGVRL